MKTYTMQELATKAIRVYNGMLVVNPFSGSEQPITVIDITLKFPTSNYYARNNSTVSFIWNSDLYVIPYTQKVLESLKENRYFEAKFKVFFSDGTFPREEQQYWFNLLAEATEQNRQDFQTEAKNWCEKHEISPLPKEFMERAMVVPDTGIEFQNINFSGIIMPMINLEKPKEDALLKVGTFNWNNSGLIFIDVDGQTYIAHRSKEFIAMLETCGFKKEDMYVPMSNGERMKEPRDQRQWDSLKEA